MTKAKRVIAITAAALLVLVLLGSCFVSDHEGGEAAEIKSEPIDTVELVIVQQAVQLAEAAEKTSCRQSTSIYQARKQTRAT